jgi:hypothetical protein
METRMIRISIFSGLYSSSIPGIPIPNYLGRHNNPYFETLRALAGKL